MAGMGVLAVPVRAVASGGWSSRSRVAAKRALLGASRTALTRPPAAPLLPPAAGASRFFSSQGRGNRSLSSVVGPGSETHGGDDIYRVDRLVCDFSSTTNPLGPVPSALAALKGALKDMEMSWISPRGGDIEAILHEVEESSQGSEHLASAPIVQHYPQRRDNDLDALLASFVRPRQGGDVQERLLFGNGASELIDLLGRIGPPGKCSMGPNQVQYKEYERACRNAGRELTADPRQASLVCIVNPNNPTGEFWGRKQMEAWITDNVAPGTWVVVDESILCFAGPTWHEQGVSAEFVERMAQKQIPIFIVHSWTKIFACTGLRIGSVLCPTLEKKKLLESQQVPWTVNAFARTYLKAALQDAKYLERTWHTTPRWREHMVSRFRRLHPEWTFGGEPWMPFIWVDVKDPQVAEQIYQATFDSGCPIRYAKHGYNLPTHLRFAVRRPYDFSVLHQALLLVETQKRRKTVTFGTYADVHPSVVEGVRLVHIDDLYGHERVLHDRAGKLQDYIRDLPVKILPAIIIDSQYQVVIDGHHRLELFRAAGMTIVPAVSVNYHHPDILVNPPGKERAGITKETVIRQAVRGELMDPKSTQHMVRSRGGALLPIIVLAPQIAEIQHHGYAGH